MSAALEGTIYRMRIVGSIAVSLCYVAAARFDGMLTTDTCRSVDAAAGQLIAREAGAFVDFLKHGGIEAPLDLDSRYRLVAARAPDHSRCSCVLSQLGGRWRTSRPSAVGRLYFASNPANWAALRTP